MALIGTILLGLLKWLAILIGSLFAFVLLVLFIVIFVPIRYQLKLKLVEGFFYGGQITWLLHFLKLSYEHEKTQNRMEIRILGIPIKKIISNPEAKNDEKATNPEEDLWQSNWQEMEEEEFKQKLWLYFSKPDDRNTLEPVESDFKAEIRDMKKRFEPQNEETISGKQKERARAVELEADLKEAEKVGKTTIVSEREIKPTESSKEAEQFKGNEESEWEEDFWEEDFWEEDELKPKEAKTRETLSKTESLKKKIDYIWKIFQLIREYFQKNRGIIQHLLKWILRIIKSILPRKLEGEILLGLKDPAHTGYVLAIFYLFYPQNHGKMSINADFEKEIWQGQVILRGRIWPAQLIYYGLRLFLSRKIWSIYVTFKKVKALTEEQA